MNQERSLAPGRRSSASSLGAGGNVSHGRTTGSRKSATSAQASGVSDTCVTSSGESHSIPGMNSL